MVTVNPSTLTVSPASALSLKVVALALMVVDHVDLYLADSALGLHDTIGRVVFPAFALILGMNLARIPRGDGLYRLASRMCIIGAVATPPYWMLQGDLLPLNVMFTLGLATAVWGLWRDGYVIPAALLAGFAGMFVDYAYFGLGAVLAGAYAFREGWSVLGAALAVEAFVVPWNGSLWSLLLLPLVWAACTMQRDAPRLKWLFYVGYPVHLAAIAAIASTIR